jgi:uncharacterized protein (DUF2147 family)
MSSIVPRLLAVMLAWIVPSAALAQGPLPEGDLIGDWVLPEGGTVIHTYRCGDALCGQIVKVPDPARRDSYNADPVLRRRPLLGVVITSSLYQKGPATWQGKVYNPLNGYTYNSTLRLLDKNRFTLDGCLVGPLFCHTKTYYRVEPPSEPKAKKPQKRTPPRPTVSRDRPAAPVAKVKPDRNAPSQADFEEFIKTLKPSDEPVTEEERQRLFKEFLAWRATR